MSRKRQTIVLIVAICSMCFFYMKTLDRYFSPQDVFFASERGRHYGPSEEILLEHKVDNNTVVVVGRCVDGLSVIQAKRKMFFLWGIDNNAIRGLRTPREGEEMVLLYGNQFPIIGLVNNANVSSVHLLVNYGENFAQTQEYTIPVAENGFFYAENILVAEDSVFKYTLEGLNDKGEVIAVTEGY